MALGDCYSAGRFNRFLGRFTKGGVDVTAGESPAPIGTRAVQLTHDLILELGVLS